MLDISDISAFKHSLEKDFVKKTMSKLADKSTQFNAAIVLYNDQAKAALNFTKTFDLDDFLHAMDNLTSPDPCIVSLPRIDSALQVTSDHIFSGPEGRDAPKVAVLFTQGVPSFTLESFPLKNVSESLKEKGVRILVVGVGMNDVAQQELLKVTEEEDDLIVVNGFSSLSEFEDVLVAKICSAVGKALFNFQV